MNPYRTAGRPAHLDVVANRDHMFPRVVAERDGTRLVAIDADRWFLEALRVTAHTDAMGHRSEVATWHLVQEIRRMTEAEREKAERYPSICQDLRKGDAMAVIIDLLAGEAK